MIEAINSNISSLQLLRAQNAFNQAKKAPDEKPEVQEQQKTKEEISSIKSSTPLEKLQDKIIDEIRGDLTVINEDITDEDIRYGLTFGRSVLVDCSA